MKRSNLILVAILFLLGFAGGWLMVASPVEVSDENEASGLPGDLSHLPFREAWNVAGGFAREELFLRWQRTEPEDAIRYFGLELVNGAPRDLRKVSNHYLNHIWPRNEPSRALNLFNSCRVEIPLPLENCLRTACEASQDLDALVAFWKSARPEVNHKMRSHVLRKLFRADPTRALKELNFIPPQERDEIWKEAEVAASEPLLTALAKPNELTAPIQLIQNRLQLWRSEDPAAVERFVIALPPGPVRRQCCAVMVRGKISKAEAEGVSDPEEILSWIEQHAPTAANRYQVASEFFGSNLPRFMEIAGSHFQPVGDFHMAISKYAASEWDSAVKLVIGSPSQAIRKVGVAALISELQPRDGTFLEKLQVLAKIINEARITPTPLPTAAYWEFQCDGDESHGVMEWLGKQSDTVQANLIHLIPPLIGELTHRRIHELLLQLPPSRVRTKYLLSIIRNLAATSFAQSAAEFVLALPPGTDREYGVLNTAIAWHRHDPKAALAWVHGLPDSPGKQLAMDELR